MREIGVDEAMDRWSDLIASVEAGEAVTLTRGGVALARLVPEAEALRAQRLEAIERVQALREQARGKATPEDILLWRDEGRR